MEVARIVSLWRDVGKKHGPGDDEAGLNAGFLRKYLEEAPLEECVEHGLLAGAYSTLKAGGTAAFDDVEAFTSFAEERREHIRVPK